MFIIFTCIVAVFFAMNIGASGAAAAMGVAYGSGAIPVRTIALTICGCGILLGAILGGGEVVKTIGSGIVPEKIITIHLALIILISASITLFFANLSGIPLSTSEVAVGAVVGVGISFKKLFVGKVLFIVLLWLFIPFISFLLAFLVNKIIKVVNDRYASLVKNKWKKVLVFLVIITGFLEAFSAGMNNVANAVGPIVAAGIVSVEKGTLLGGISVAIGAIFLGGKVLETNGKRITNLCLLQGGAISGIGATLVIIASVFGIPVPQAQITTSSILGIGVSENGKEMWKKPIIMRLIRTWAFSPVISLGISYILVGIFIHHYSFFIPILCILVLVFAILYVANLVKDARYSFFKFTSVSNFFKILFLPIEPGQQEIQSTRYEENS